MNGVTHGHEGDLSLPHRLVAARLEFVRLTRALQHAQARLRATEQTKQAISEWTRDEPATDKQARLEERIRKVEKELRDRRSKRTVTQGAVFALDHSLLVNSHLQASVSPPLPHRHAILQGHIVERDTLSFSLLRSRDELSNVASELLATRKRLTALNRKNVNLVKTLRERHCPSTDIISHAPSHLMTYSRELGDEILLLTTRLSIISPVVQSIISESSLPYFSQNPQSPSALLEQLGDLSPKDESAVTTDSEEEGDKVDTSTDRWMGLFLLAGHEWNEAWDPLLEGVGTEKGVELPSGLEN